MGLKQFPLNLFFVELNQKALSLLAARQALQINWGAFLGLAVSRAQARISVDLTSQLLLDLSLCERYVTIFCLCCCG